MSRRYFICAVLLLVAAMWSRGAISVALSDVAAAQSPSMAVKVVDTSRGPLPGVSITAGEGGIARHSTSASDGGYRFDALPDGTYRIDFEFLGFDLLRRNNVRVLRGATAKVDAALSIGALCECISVRWPELRERDGQVVAESGPPLPSARLEIVTPSGREVALSDRKGRFRIRAPVNGTWPLTASDNGFDAITQQVSGTVATPIMFTLPNAATRTSTLPDSERFSRGCCAGDLFVHPGRWGRREW
jgi:hypothetical protein